MLKGNIKKVESFCIEENIKIFSITNRVMKAFIEEKHLCAGRQLIKDAPLLACVQAIDDRLTQLAKYEINQYAKTSQASKEGVHYQLDEWLYTFIKTF